MYLHLHYPDHRQWATDRAGGSRRRSVKCALCTLNAPLYQIDILLPLQGQLLDYWISTSPLPKRSGCCLAYAIVLFRNTTICGNSLAITLYFEGTRGRTTKKGGKGEKKKRRRCYRFLYWKETNEKVQFQKLVIEYRP